LLRFGTPWVWVVDPEGRGVFDCTAGGSLFGRKKDMELIGGDILPDFRCKVADLFAMPGQAS
jgi:hypothetical protein